jgi:translation initiation factor eIF-2B subunit alpha
MPSNQERESTNLNGCEFTVSEQSLHSARPTTSKNHMAQTADQLTDAVSKLFGLSMSPTLHSVSSSVSSTRLPLKPGVVYSTNGEFDIREHYFKLLSDDPTKSMPIAAIESLSAQCDETKAGTIHELMSAIEDGANALKASIPNAISLTAGCELFKRFIIAHAHNDPKDFEAFKRRLQANGHLFAQRAREARNLIAELGSKAIRDGVTVFLHGHSRCVIGLLLKAAEKNVRFNCIVTETRPSLLGIKSAKELRAAGIPTAVVDDNAIGYALKKAKIVVIGAEGVFGDGSILNIVLFPMSFPF